MITPAVAPIGLSLMTIFVPSKGPASELSDEPCLRDRSDNLCLQCLSKRGLEFSKTP